mmetsp:Transcript_8795/g.21739  ORF Transcript_8795/g.21739 Transcript_8795/m.21739 type:complete len:274 (-) Transcript_8795:304-1125(-)
MLGTPPPNQRILEFLAHVSVNGVTEPAHVDAATVRRQHHRLLEVGLLPHLLRIHSHEGHLFPQPLQEPIQVQLLVTTDRNGHLLPCNSIHLLDRAHVHLVVHVKALDVAPVPLDDVDEVVDRNVFSDKKLAVVNLVLVEDTVHHLLVHLGERDHEGDGDAAGLLELEVDVRGALVEADAARLELAREDVPVPVRLGRVQDHEEQVGALADGDDLPASPLALRRPLDDTRQVQQLDLRVVVVNHARDAGQGGELVRSRLRVRPRELREQRRLSH